MQIVFFHFSSDKQAANSSDLSSKSTKKKNQKA